jgi:hypothetical protein
MYFCTCIQNWHDFYEMKAKSKNTSVCNAKFSLYKIYSIDPMKFFEYIKHILETHFKKHQRTKN